MSIRNRKTNWEDSNVHEDEDLSPLYRPRKRQRFDDSEADDTGDDASEQSGISFFSDQSYIKRNAQTETELLEVRAKSRHKIHIPKNSDIPKDAFYTQPPQISSSPYRIAQFNWRKPKRSDTTPPPTKGCSKEDASSLLASQRNKNNQALSHYDTDTDASNFPAKSASGRVKPCQSNLDSIIPTYNDDQSSRTILPKAVEAQVQAYEDVLAGLPSDAFSSSTTSEQEISNEPDLMAPQRPKAKCVVSASAKTQKSVAPSANLRQTTLFGDFPQEPFLQTESQPQVELQKSHNWPLANREEPPTHHKLDRDALMTWVYPTNLGSIREYQYNIVSKGLYHNLLVALPTGLGKTFIAATVMLNWFRWTIDAQIVFVAPTKPLVSQQVKACFDIVGIPRSTTSMLTGGIPPGIRAEEWLSKRVFFMTPQTIINDLKTGICDPKRIVLLVVDEAHRATGSYAYVEVVKFLSRFNSSFRVLALTATPGASIEAVQEVIDGLKISRIEIRTEESLDIRQYVHSRKVETVLFENSEDMVTVMELFSKSLKPVLDKLNAMNAYWARDPMTLTPYGCNQARMKWMSSDAGKNASFAIKGMVNTIFSLLASLAHGIELLKFHGIGPFFHKILGFCEDDGEKGGKYRKQVIDCKEFQTMTKKIQTWTSDSAYVGHPKLDYLQSIVLRHFLDAGEGRGGSAPSSTRIMVFAHYRDSAEEIARVLKRNEPMIRPHVFVGQANSKGSDGMDQKTQLKVIKKFQEGDYNTLIATSIGEEGLDIGEVDLIVCYDASASPIRMLQRMGRTGRKRAGNIVVTLMKGKEEDNFAKAKDNYERMQKEIAIGTRFDYRHKDSQRIVPKDVQPVVNKKIIEIPLENSQAELPEPKRRAKPPKRPPKKFHMPDGIRPGFVKASRVDGGEIGGAESVKDSSPRNTFIVLEPVPSLDEVLLTVTEEKQFERGYLNVEGDTPQIVDRPRLDRFPELQRFLRRTKYVKQGRAAIRFAQLMESMNNSFGYTDDRYSRNLDLEDRKEADNQEKKRIAFYIKNVVPSRTRQVSESQLPSSLHNAGVTTPGQESTLSVIEDSRYDFTTSKDQGNDNNPDNDAEKAGLAARKSVTALLAPSPKLAHSKLFYQPTLKSYADSDSAEELPDFSTLVRRNNHTATSALIGTTNGNVTSKPNRRSWKRRVIQEDSDEN